MNELLKAWFVLGLTPGSSRDAIERRYKHLVFASHPDRFMSETGKTEAQEDLIKINAARELLLQHIDSGEHQLTDCICMRVDEEDVASNFEEELAKRRDEERRRANTVPSGEPADPNSVPSNLQASLRAESLGRLSNNSRWLIAAGELTVFIGITVFGVTGYQATEWWHDVSFKWQSEHQSRISTRIVQPPKYVPPYEVAPNSQLAPIQQSVSGQSRLEAERQQKASDDLIARDQAESRRLATSYAARVSAQYDARANDPTLSDSERAKAMEMSQFEQNQVSTNLRYSQPSTANTFSGLNTRNDVYAEQPSAAAANESDKQPMMWGVLKALITPESGTE